MGVAQGAIQSGAFAPPEGVTAEQLQEIEDLVNAEIPKHGKISRIFHDADPMFHNLPDAFNVVRYHSLICQHLKQNIDIIAETEQKETMAIKHKKLPLYGIQFHPEAFLTDYGLKILKNWKNINSITN